MKNFLRLSIALLFSFFVMNIAFAETVTQNVRVGQIGVKIDPSQFAIYNYTGAQMTITWAYPGQGQQTTPLYPAYSQGNPYGVAWTVLAKPYNYMIIYSVTDIYGTNYAAGTGYGGSYWSINPYSKNGKMTVRVIK